MYDTVSWLIWLAGIFVACLLVSAFVSDKAGKKAERDEELEQIDSKAAAVSALIFADMGVPSTVVEAEILSFRYVLKDGQPVAQKMKGETTAYDNCVCKVYADGGKLFIADVESKYAFNLSELRAIRTVSEKISVPLWYKDTEPNKKPYKQYKLYEDDTGDVHFKPYHILELENNGETWGIYFPCYELPVFETLTSLTAE